MIAQTCSGVKVAGAPERGASVSRNTTGASVGPANQRARQWRTVLGQAPSWRAISRTDVPVAERKIISARSAKLRGVFCARTRRSSSNFSSGARAIGTAERRGMARLRAIRGKAQRLLPFSRRSRLAKTVRAHQIRRRFRKPVAERTHPPLRLRKTESAFPARCTSRSRP